MKWIDTLSATCSSCGAEDKYSVETLRSLTATCISCGYSLASVGKDMIKAEKNNSAFIQTIYCILELEELLDINLEETDEIEMVENLTIGRLIYLSEQKLKKKISVYEVLEIVLNKMLKNRKTPFEDNEKIWDLFLKDLKNMKYKNKSYIITSPDAPEKKDFEKFNVWCEWYDPEEIPYIKSLCESEDEYLELIIKPYEDGKNIYYPVCDFRSVPEREFLFAFVNVVIDSIDFQGYVSIVTGEVVALTIWIDHDFGDELSFYKYDRLMADEENKKTIEALVDESDISTNPLVSYSSDVVFENSTKLNGIFNWKEIAQKKVDK